jgi:hypothetical protein
MSTWVELVRGKVMLEVEVGMPQQQVPMVGVLLPTQMRVLLAEALPMGLLLHQISRHLKLSEANTGAAETWRGLRVHLLGCFPSPREDV